MFTSALRRTDAEASSAIALTGAGEGGGAEIGTNLEDEDAVVGAEADVAAFFFDPRVVSDEVAVAPFTSEEENKEDERDDREKSDISKNIAEVVLVFTVGAGSIARVSKKFAMKIPTKSAAIVPKYDSKRFIRIR